MKMENKKGKITAGVVMVSFIAILIGLAFIEPVQDFTDSANVSLQVDNESYNTRQTLVNLVPMFYVLLVLGIAITPLVLAYRSG